MRPTVLRPLGKAGHLLWAYMEAAVATEIATLLTHGLYKSPKIELSENRV